MTNNNKKSITAACCVIGDEILSGKTKDTNSHYLATILFDLGIELKRIQVIADDEKEIIKTVRELSANYDIVITSGGIGTTHDDITYASIASAFGLKMKVDQKTYSYIEKQLSKRKNGPVKMTKNHARMVTFPHPARLLRERNDLNIPIVVVNDNIYILPGIPSLFKILLDSLVPRLKKLSNSKFYRTEIATQQSEPNIADTLTAAQLKADAFNIKIGSYPVWGKHPENVRVVVTVSGKDQVKVDEFSREITKEIQGWPYTSNKTSRL